MPTSYLATLNIKPSSVGVTNIIFGEEYEGVGEREREEREGGGRREWGREEGRERERERESLKCPGYAIRCPGM